MKFSEIIAEEARRVKLQADDTKFLAVAMPCINLALTDVGDSWRWPQLDKTASVVGVPIYSTGTANITIDSNVVTLVSPAVVAADFAGRFFKKQGSGNSYRILAVSVGGNTLTLDQPIIEATESGALYEIEKRFYTLPTEVREIIGWDAGVDRVMGLDQQGLRNTVPNIGTPLNDTPFKVAGTDEFSEDYTTGMVSAADGTNVLTNNGASEWLKYAKPGNIINFGDQDYRVKRVESDARIILYNKVEGDQGPTAYTLSIDDALTLRPYGAFTEKRLIQFQYIRRLYDLVHDDDRSPLTRKANLAVLDFAQAYIKEALGADGWETILIKAIGRLASAQATSGPVRAAFKTFPPLIPRGMGRR